MWRRNLKPISSNKYSIKSDRKQNKIVGMGDDWTKEPAKGQMFAPFGPTIYTGVIHPNHIDELNRIIADKVEDTSLDVGGQLAGRVEKQITIQDFISEDLSNHIKNHVTNYTSQQDMPVEDFHITMDGLWVNLAQKRDFNPRHQHNGEFSFVIYTKNTVDPNDVLNNKWDNNHDAEHNKIAGNIELHYGEAQFMNNTRFMHQPTVGDILVFPAWLQHSVYPFYCNGERWSVAGNYRWTTWEELNPPQE